MLRETASAAALCVGLGAALGACGGGGSAPTVAGSLTATQLLDPTSCASCHPSHASTWSGSMHAYASDDPLFVAMNARYQRETQGRNPAFCVQCHAPMALRTGATTDGTNLASLPAKLHGVTCAFCHTVDAANGSSDDPLALAEGGVMRGEIADPSPAAPHGAAYSALHDADQPQAATLCGTCHDVETPAGVAVESTFAEWRTGLYSGRNAADLLTCAGCHMPASSAPAADVPGAPVRRVHDHSFAAVDTASTPFPNAAAQQMLVRQNLDSAIVAQLCVEPSSAAGDGGAGSSGLTVTLTLDNAFVGHSWPSGASHDRRAWAEVVASAAGQPVYQSGVVAAGQDVTTLTNQADPDLWLLREELFDGQANEVKMMWQAASAITTALSVVVTTDPTDPRYDHSVSKVYGVPSTTDAIAARVRMTPVGLDVVGDLVAGGDLDPSYAGTVPVYTLGGTALTWTLAANGFGCIQ